MSNEELIEQQKAVLHAYHKAQKNYRALASMLVSAARIMRLLSEKLDHADCQPQHSQIASALDIDTHDASFIDIERLKSLIGEYEAARKDLLLQRRQIELLKLDV